jgi:hypothetical protein
MTTANEQQRNELVAVPGAAAAAEGSRSQTLKRRGGLF